MTQIKTEHFRTLRDAYRYYEPLGFTQQDVNAKLDAHEIRIGPPPRTLDTLFVTLDKDNRYVIHCEDQ